MSAPRFSVIVPVYNVEEYLSQCLDSLLAQSYHDFEVVVIDDVSTDSSKQIAIEYADHHPEKIRLVCHQVNKGLGGARNTGIEAAAGQYLLFLDSDDYLLPETLEKIAEVIELRQPQIVEFCFRLVDEDGRYLSRMHCPEHAQQLPVLVRHTVNACNKAIQRQLFEQCNISFPEKKYYEDYWTIPKLLLSAKDTVMLNEDLYCYRQRTGSIIHNTNTKKNTDIMVGTDCLLAYLSEHDLGEDARTQLEYLVILHVLYHATLRVNDIDWTSPLQKELKDYVQTNFPNWRDNPYRDRMAGRQQRLLKIIENEKYFLLYLNWHCRNRISGVIKKMLPRRG